MTESITQIKQRYPTIMLVLLLSVVSFIWFSYDSLSSGITLKVVSTGQGVIERHTDLQVRGHFVSGREGELYWKPRSLTEAMILRCIVPGYGLDLFDIVALAITMLGIVYTFMDSKDGTVFSRKMATGFKSVILVLVCAGILSNVGRHILANHYLPIITNGQFRVNYDYHINFYYPIVLGLVMSLTNIPKSGLELQKEQELTI